MTYEIIPPEIPGGYTIWSRQMIDNRVFYDKPGEWFKIWFYIVNKVNHTDSKRYKRGAGFMRYEQIQDATKATKNQVKHCIEYLKNKEMIATQKATRGMIVTVCKYNYYQDRDNYKSHKKRKVKGIQKEHESHTKNNNGNNGKNENKPTNNNSSSSNRCVTNESKEKKYIYGEDKKVRLTQKQYEKLKDRLGEQIRDDYIDRLNDYICQKGKRYKSHYHTILNWVRKDGINGKVKSTKFKDLEEETVW